MEVMDASAGQIGDRLVLGWRQPLEQHSCLGVDHGFRARRWILIVPLQKLRPRIRSGRAEVRSRTHCRICRQRLTISIAQRYVRCQEAPGGLAAAARDSKVMSREGLWPPRIPPAVFSLPGPALARHEYAL